MVSNSFCSWYSVNGASFSIKFFFHVVNRDKTHLLAESCIDKSILYNDETVTAGMTQLIHLEVTVSTDRLALIRWSVNLVQAKKFH